MSNTAKVSVSIEWQKPKGNNGQHYSWGDQKNNSLDTSWSKSCVIYRWVRKSDNATAVIGETRRSLNARTNNYLHGGTNGAGLVNQRVYIEQKKLAQTGDNLYLEFIDSFNDSDIRRDSDRKCIEKLLTYYYKPYLNR